MEIGDTGGRKSHTGGGIGFEHLINNCIMYNLINHSVII